MAAWVPMLEDASRALLRACDIQAAARPATESAAASATLAADRISISPAARELARSASQPAAQTIGALDSVVVHVGPGHALDAVAEVARGARQSLRGEFFALKDPKIARAVRKAAATGVDAKILGDEEMLHLGQFNGKLTRQEGLTIVPYSGEANKLHAKAVVADSNRAAITTATPKPSTRQDRSVEVAIEFGGKPAAALQKLMDADMSGDAARIRQAATEAASLGILINDAKLGIHTLTDGVEGLIDGAATRVQVVSKCLTDSEAMAHLARAQDRGVEVLTNTSKMTRRQNVDKAAEMGLDVRPQKSWKHRIHANIVVVDHKVAYVGSMFFDKRPLGRAWASRKSHEIGVVLEDPGAIAKLERLASKLEGKGSPTTKS